GRKGQKGQSPQDLLKKTVNILARRENSTLQLRTTDLHTLLLEIFPDDACCLLGITMFDLYPQESWNYVFGEALCHQRVGVFSFCRYLPNDIQKESSLSSSSSLSTQEFSRFVRRSLQVFVHETLHMLNIEHCLYFDCVMNGANCLDESDLQPL